MVELLTKIWKALTSMRDAKGRLGKKWIRSKTLWVNFVVVLAVVFSNYLNTAMTAEETASILAVVNLVLRLITTEPVGFIED